MVLLLITEAIICSDGPMAEIREIGLPIIERCMEKIEVCTSSVTVLRKERPQMNHGNLDFRTLCQEVPAFSAPYNPPNLLAQFSGIVGLPNHSDEAIFPEIRSDRVS